MKYGIFSDIHSNLLALEAVLTALGADGVDGDALPGRPSGVLQPTNEVVEKVCRTPHWKTVMEPRRCLPGPNPPDLLQPARCRSRCVWTRERLKPAARAYLGALRLREEIGDITCVHASPHQSEQWHYLNGVEDLAMNFRFFQGYVCFFGHVHTPFVAEAASRWFGEDPFQARSLFWTRNGDTW